MITFTPANFGWVIAIWLIAGTATAGIWNGISDRWEITRGRPARRWYGPGAHVCLRADESADDAHRYLVTLLDDEDTEVPWLRVRDIDDEEAEPFYAPVTVFAPHSVPRLRPHILMVGRIPVPQLRDYRVVSS